MPWEAPGYPAPVRSPDVPPLPGPGEWPSQQPRSRRTLVFVLIGVIVLLLVAGGVAAALILPGKGKATDKQAGTATLSPSASPSPRPSPTPPPSFRAAATPVTVIGQTFQPTDKTKVQAFDNWPFAFRTPADMTCQFWVGQPDYKANNCNRGVQPNHTVMAFVIHKCVNGCDATERAQFETMTPWKPDVALTTKDATTRFGDVDYGNGRVQLTVLHYFSTTPGGPLSWVVIVQGNSPTAERETVRKVVNDIRTQTG